jgi:hypothetical protein
MSHFFLATFKILPLSLFYLIVWWWNVWVWISLSLSYLEFIQISIFHNIWEVWGFHFFSNVLSSLSYLSVTPSIHMLVTWCSLTGLWICLLSFIICSLHSSNDKDSVWPIFKFTGYFCQIKSIKSCMRLNNATHTHTHTHTHTKVFTS